MQIFRLLTVCMKINQIPYFILEATSQFSFNLLSANPTKWSNTLKQFVGKLPTNCLSVFDHFVKLALKGLSFALPFSVMTYKSSEIF